MPGRPRQISIGKPGSQASGRIPDAIGRVSALGLILLLMPLLSAMDLHAQDRPRGLPFMTLPPGTVVQYDKWRCEVESSEGLERVCRDKNRRARFYGVFALFGKLDTTRYGGAIASMNCDALASLMPVSKQSLDKAAVERINKFWPLRVGKRTRFNLRHGSRASQIIEVDLRASHRERIVVGGRTRQVVVVKGRSGYVDCPNNRIGNYLSDVGGTIYVDQTWWYEPKTGLIIKYEARWPHEFGRAEYYELVRVSFPKPPQALDYFVDDLPRPSMDEEEATQPKLVTPKPDQNRTKARGSAPVKKDRPAKVASAKVSPPASRRNQRPNLKRRASATGFYVSRAGHVVTNDHVLQRCEEMRVPGTAGIALRATIIGRDSRNDLALLKVPDRPKHIATFRSGRRIRLGEEIVIYGFPLRGLLAAGGNLTIGIISARSGIRGDTRHLQITAPVQPGNSGGPLLDRSGNVIGVVMSKLDAIRVAKITGDIPQNINFAIKTPMVQAFLDVHDVPYETRASAQELKVVEVSDQAATFTVVVECWR